MHRAKPGLLSKLLDSIEKNNKARSGGEACAKCTQRVVQRARFQSLISPSLII
jgi:hypothetical protein